MAAPRRLRPEAFMTTDERYYRWLEIKNRDGVDAANLWLSTLPTVISKEAMWRVR